MIHTLCMANFEACANVCSLTRLFKRRYILKYWACIILSEFCSDATTRTQMIQFALRANCTSSADFPHFNFYHMNPLTDKVVARWNVWHFLVQQAKHENAIKKYLPKHVLLHGWSCFSLLCGLRSRSFSGMWFEPYRVRILQFKFLQQYFCKYSSIFRMHITIQV